MKLFLAKTILMQTTLEDGWRKVGAGEFGDVAYIIMRHYACQAERVEPDFLR